MRAITRAADLSLSTITELLVDAGKACAAYHDERVWSCLSEVHPAQGEEK